MGTLRTDAARRRIQAVAIGAGIVVITVSVLLVMATSGTTERVAGNARQLHITNAALGSVSVARVANAQAVFFAVDRAAGFASQDALDRAMLEADLALEDVSEVAVALRSIELNNAGDVLDGFISAGKRVLEYVQMGDAEAALATNADGLEPAYRQVEIELTGEIERIQAAIERSEGSAGRITSITQVVVTLLIPLAAFVLYRYLIRRQLAERRIEFQAKLEAERELSRSKDEFIAGLSHEFRTPLTAIFGFSEMLIEQGIVDPEMSIELIGLINSESAELSRMVEDLLMAARLEAGEVTIEQVDLDIVGEVESVLAPFVRTGWSFLTDVESVGVRGDALRIRQVLRNLVSNAVKHGGENIGVCGRATPDGYRLAVIDDGGGVSPEIAERLFQRFVHDGRGALLTGSVGLGLNIARSLAEAMDGGLAYERIGESTVFTLSLPVPSTFDPEVDTPVSEVA
jgi:signal transduction histidine kinase